MNKSMKSAAVLALSAALLGACSPNAKQTAAPGDTPATITPSGSIEPSATPSAASSPAPGSPGLPSSPSAAPGTSPAAATAPLYKLNGNYDLVPIDPANGASKKVVLLTFDDGPKASATLNPLLDALDKHKAKAIFFVNGNRVKENPDLLKTIHQRGQTVGNHTWSHIDLSKESNAKIDKELEDVQTIVKDTIGVEPVFLRPPFGSSNAYVRQKADELGLLRMNWSNGSLDWDASSKNKPDAVIQHVLEQLHSGSNILMHELPWTGEALDTLLTKLEEQGYGFVDPTAIQTISKP